MAKEILCLATFVSKKNTRENLKKELIKLLNSTRKEKGCISYDLYENSENSNIFTLIEKYKNEEDFTFHGEQEYLIGFKKKLNELVDNVTVKIY